jgi:hypothetical protein
MRWTIISPKLACLGRLICGTLVAWLAPLPVLHADQVEMQNGDHYAGTVISLNADTLTLKSEVLGTLRLPRRQVALVALGNRALTNSGPAMPHAQVESAGNSAGTTNLLPALPAALTQPGASTNLNRQSVMQLVNDAGPEARNKFTELMGGYLSGKLSVDDIRDQAKSAADQLRALKNDLGPDASSAIDGYLAILDHFLGQSPSGASPVSKTPDLTPKVKPAPAQLEE